MTTVNFTKIVEIPCGFATYDTLANAAHYKKPTIPNDQISILQHHPSFHALVGHHPTFSVVVPSSASRNPFFHGACVFVAPHDELYATSDLLEASQSSQFPTVLISRVKLTRRISAGAGAGAVDGGGGGGGKYDDGAEEGGDEKTAEGEDETGENGVQSAAWAKMRPPRGIDMPGGGANYGASGTGILFCAQGSDRRATGGIYHMPRAAASASSSSSSSSSSPAASATTTTTTNNNNNNKPAANPSSSSSSTPHPLVTNLHGLALNSPRDVAVCPRDGSVWFTDPDAGFQSGFRPRPRLPSQVYRFEPATGDLRAVADGLEVPGGIAFAPGGGVLYVSDTGRRSREGRVDVTRPSTIYAFDVTSVAGGVFLTGRRVFAFAPTAAGMGAGTGSGAGGGGGGEGGPSCVRVDVHGNVWAGYGGDDDDGGGGGGLGCWSPAGTLLGRLVVPGGVGGFCFGRGGEMFLCGGQRLWRVQLAASTRGAILEI